MSILNEVITITEAGRRWGLGRTALQKRVNISNMLVEGVDCRKSGKIWLITEDAMIRLYGQEEDIRTRYIDITNRKYKRLTAIKKVGFANKSALWECKCECGNICYATYCNLEYDRVGSCGCIRQEYYEKYLLPNSNKYKFKGTNVSQIKSTKISKNNTSGVKGVCRTYTGKWRAYITVSKEVHRLGDYYDLKDAVKARKEAEEKYHKPIIDEFYKDKKYTEIMFEENKELISSPVKFIVENDKIEDKNNIKGVITIAEASQIWGVSISMLKRLIYNNKLKEGTDYKKSGAVWLTTKEVMRRLYGNENITEVIK